MYNYQFIYAWLLQRRWKEHLNFVVILHAHASKLLMQFFKSTPDWKVYFEENNVKSNYVNLFLHISLYLYANLYTYISFDNQSLENACIPISLLSGKKSMSHS